MRNTHLSFLRKVSLAFDEGGLAGDISISVHRFHWRCGGLVSWRSLSLMSRTIRTLRSCGYLSRHCQKIVTAINLRIWMTRCTVAPGGLNWGCNSTSLRFPSYVSGIKIRRYQYHNLFLEIENFHIWYHICIWMTLEISLLLRQRTFINSQQSHVLVLLGRKLWHQVKQSQIEGTFHLLTFFSLIVRSKISLADLWS